MKKLLIIISLVSTLSSFAEITPVSPGEPIKAEKLNEVIEKVNTINQIDSLLAVFNQKSLTANGYQKLPSGLIIQWGTTPKMGNNGVYTVSFPIPFPTQTLNVQITAASRTGQSYNREVDTVTNSGFRIRGDSAFGENIYWFAIGI